MGRLVGMRRYSNLLEGRAASVLILQREKRLSALNINLMQIKIIVNLNAHSLSIRNRLELYISTRKKHNHI